MDFHALNYSFVTLCLVAIISFLLGRWSKSDYPQRGAKPIGEVRTPMPHAKHNRRADALSANAQHEIEQLLANGRLIAAVKVARKELGLGLKDAKDLVDQLRHKS